MATFAAVAGAELISAGAATGPCAHAEKLALSVVISNVNLLGRIIPCSSCIEIRVASHYEAKVVKIKKEKSIDIVSKPLGLQERCST